MLTILNLINYFTGDNLSIYILIVATIVIYYFIFTNYLQNIYDNKLYLSIFIMLMLIDITSIIIIFYYRDDGSSEESGIINTNKEKKDKKDRKERRKERNNKNEIKDKKGNANLINSDTNEAKVSDKEDSKKNFNSIKVFNESPDETISTYKN